MRNGLHVTHICASAPKLFSCSTYSQSRGRLYIHILDEKALRPVKEPIIWHKLNQIRSS